jgi:uncharacterized protein YmfQ (DUF2313 family)
MSRTAAQAQAGVLALYPDGWVFSRDGDDYPAALELPTGAEWSLVEQTMESFEQELDPGTAQHLLPDYLEVLGPDPYGRDLLTFSEVQQSLLAHQRWVDAPTICAGYFIDSAAALGITITIDEFPRVPCGVFKAGNTLRPTPQHCVFRVNLPTNLVWHAKSGSFKCGNALGGFTPSLLENFIRDKAPLFTRPVFSYTGPS